VVVRRVRIAQDRRAYPSLQIESYEGKTLALGDGQAWALLDAPGAETLKGRRDRPILWMLLYHGLRRGELVTDKVRYYHRITHTGVLETSMESDLVYGHWGVALLYSLAWSIAILVLIRPRTLRELLVFALFAIFLIDEFAELYGLPFSINFVSRWIAFYPETGLFSRRNGELWRILLKQPEHPGGFDPYYLGGGVLIFGGLGVLYYAWMVLKAAQASCVPATTGPYAWVRHPQYLALIAIMLGNIIVGPTLPTLALFPLLTSLYVLLARREEQEVRTNFGPAYALYMQRTHGFLP
jgi:hypothetical protein